MRTKLDTRTWDERWDERLAQRFYHGRKLNKTLAFYVTRNLFVKWEWVCTTLLLLSKQKFIYSFIHTWYERKYINVEWHSRKVWNNSPCVIFMKVNKIWSSCNIKLKLNYEEHYAVRNKLCIIFINKTLLNDENIR